MRVLVRYSEYREMEGDHARALSLCEEALPLCNEDLDEEESPERTRLFLETAEALAGLCLHEKKYGMSGSLYQRCVSLRADLVRQERTPEDFRALAALSGRAGYAMGETGHYDKAVLYYESCFSLWDLLLKEEPLREDLEEAEEDYEAAALFYSRRKSYDKARDCYEKALALERRLRDGSPEQDGLLADVCTRFAGFLIYDGNDSERARALLEEALMICSLHESLFIRQMIIRDRIREHFG